MMVKKYRFLTKQNLRYKCMYLFLAVTYFCSHSSHQDSLPSPVYKDKPVSISDLNAHYYLQSFLYPKNLKIAIQIIIKF